LALRVAAALTVLAGLAYWVYGGAKLESTGRVAPHRVPAQELAARVSAQPGSGQTKGRLIVFGDLHVHTTFSTDAFLRSLPLMGGEGAAPPSDACDFARYCSNLDFFAITDHGEALSAPHWRDIKQSVRDCNAAAGDPADPDVVAFTGFEWSHVGTTAEEHYGHKNVIFKGTADDELPTRPIGAPGPADRAMRESPIPLTTILQIPIREFRQRQRYLNFARYLQSIKRMPMCKKGVPVRELPADCRERAANPRELFDKLDEWGFDSLVIPHGTTWGFYTPPGYSFDKQLTETQHDADKQRLIEVYSGHGNSEEYRSFRAVTDDGQCPAPSADYEPCCHRAGEIIRERCADPSSAECEARVVAARANYLKAGVGGHTTVPGTEPHDWKDCGTCRTCFAPSFQYRPRGSAQYILARGGDRMRMGFIASSDNHSARPGTGFKEVNRARMTEAGGAREKAWRDRILGDPLPPKPESISFTREQLMNLPPFRLIEIERQASFFMTGGLVAAHASGRDRDSIWDALRRREVYGTSGDRMLLWFDLIDADGRAHPMGSEVKTTSAPHFRARALGAFEQKDGCAPWVESALGGERVERLCASQCYFPSDVRHKLDRIEVVRIRPQRDPSEPLESLIEDPWKTYECPGGQDECVFEFDDPDFERNTIYYVRALQAPTPAINADPTRCERDASGACVKARMCYSDWRGDREDDCLGEQQERAWSSPIFVDVAPKGQP